MTYLIRCKAASVAPFERNDFSVPMHAHSYEEAVEQFYRYLGQFGYVITDVSILDYEEF